MLKGAYETLMQDFTGFLKSGAVLRYSLIDCVTIHSPTMEDSECMGQKSQPI